MSSAAHLRALPCHSPATPRSLPPCHRDIDALKAQLLLVGSVEAGEAVAGSTELDLAVLPELCLLVVPLDHVMEVCLILLFRFLRAAYLVPPGCQPALVRRLMFLRKLVKDSIGGSELHDLFLFHKRFPDVGQLLRVLSDLFCLLLGSDRWGVDMLRISRPSSVGVNMIRWVEAVQRLKRVAKTFESRLVTQQAISTLHRLVVGRLVDFALDSNA